MTPFTIDNQTMHCGDETPTAKDVSHLKAIMKTWNRKNQKHQDKFNARNFEEYLRTAKSLKNRNCGVMKSRLQHKLALRQEKLKAEAHQSPVLGDTPTKTDAHDAGNLP